MFVPTRIFLGAVALCCLSCACVAQGQAPEHVEVFLSKADGYDTYRIPALMVSAQGTVLAFCEGRKSGRGDAGNIDLVLKRSADGGKTFSQQAIVWDDGENTCGNPCPILDRSTGFIWLLMTRNLGSDVESKIIAGTSKESRTVWVTHSEDDGITWAKPLEITADTKKAEWRWYATGPGAGMQMKSGRMVAPCDYVTANHEGYSHVIYSDDHGKTWKLGGSAGPGCNESRVVELSDGKLLLNMRNYKGSKEKARAIATSGDGGLTWSALSHDKTLIEPICQAALIRMPGEGAARFLFSNPASSKREKITVRLSVDDCRTWAASKELFAGPSAYSDLAVLPDGTILCLYERGEKSAYEKISLARFTAEWLKAP